MTKMTDLNSSIRAQAHKANIERYRKLLVTPLTRIEREYVMRRIADERTSLKRLEEGADEASARAPRNHLLAQREKKRAAELPWEQRL
jgi:hypothetical protein